MHAELRANRIWISGGYLYKETIKEIQGRYWHPENKMWSVPFNEKSIAALRIIGCTFQGELATSSHVKPKYEEVSLETMNIQMPVKAVPYVHQRRGFHFICRLMGLEEGGGANEHPTK